MDSNFALQDRFLEKFFPTPVGQSFYLTGGTALARFYFFHRESVDLDLFTQEQHHDFSHIHRLILNIAYQLGLKITNQVVTDSFLQYIFTDETQFSLKVDIVKDIPVHFGVIHSEGVVRLDNLVNIGVNKILAIFGRTDAKDFIDLYWILKKSELTFEHLYQLAKHKDLGLSELYFAYSLQQVTHIQHFPKMLEPLPWLEITTYFQQQAKELLLRIKPSGQ